MNILTPEKVDLIKKRNEILKEDRYRLHFGIDDIDYILVNKKTEILDMIHFVRYYYKDKYTLDEIDLLLTKIISLESIKSDF